MRNPAKIVKSTKPAPPINEDYLPCKNITWIDDGPQWMYDPETGEKMYRTKKNEELAEQWKKDNPGREPHIPTNRCLRCKLLKPIASFMPKVGRCYECKSCRDNMEEFARKRDSSFREAAVRETDRILRGGVEEEITIAPEWGRGDKEFECAISDAHKHSMGRYGDSGLEALDTCLLCEEYLENVHSVKSKDVHFHAGGVCGGCAVQFLCEQEEPDDVDCPICIAERRPTEQVAKLHFPYFGFDATLTALAHVTNGKAYGKEDFYEMQEGEEEEPEVRPPSKRKGGKKEGKKKAADKEEEGAETAPAGEEKDTRPQWEVVDMRGETPPSPKRAKTEN
eukprot:jgi/Mesvir1/28753/Mv19721-RA.1